LQRALDDLAKVDSFVIVSTVVLRSPGSSIDEDVATTLDAAYERIVEIRERLEGVLASLEGTP
jgi:hypothetical protein